MKKDTLTWEHKQFFLLCCRHGYQAAILRILQTWGINLNEVVGDESGLFFAVKNRQVMFTSVYVIVHSGQC